ncbi:MAG: ABC-type transport auxiliary lipoprotein family protein [Planctomycetota bacterium]
MNAPFRPKAAALALAALVSPACLSLTPDAPPPVRWLSIMPSASRPGTSQTGVTTPEPNVPRLRLGSVTASDAITDQYIRRISAVELQYADFVRWAESPAVVVERLLEDELFQRQGFTLDTRATRRLDVEIIAFEEQQIPRRQGHIAIIAKLVAEDGQALVNRRFEATLPVDGEDPALVAEALTEGIQRVAREVGELIALK